jgi:hypothetical protein
MAPPIRHKPERGDKTDLLIVVYAVLSRGVLMRANPKHILELERSNSFATTVKRLKDLGADEELMAPKAPLKSA